MRDTRTQRSRDREEAGSMQGAQCGTRSWNSRITPWAQGRSSTAEPPRDPQVASFKLWSRKASLRDASQGLTQVRKGARARQRPKGWGDRPVSAWDTARRLATLEQGEGEQGERWKCEDLG